MIRNFYIKEHEESERLIYIFNQILAIGFGDSKLKKRLQLIKMLDEYIADNSDIPVAFITFEHIKKEGINDISLSDVEDKKSGLEVVFEYFYKKAKQYQKHCVDKNDNGIYSDEEMESLRHVYSTSPVTGIKSEVDFNKWSYKKYYYLNNKIAFDYAYKQFAECISCINYDSVYYSYDEFQKMEFIYMVRKAMKKIIKRNKKVKKTTNSKFIKSQVYKIVCRRDEKMKKESQILEDLKFNLANLLNDNEQFLVPNYFNESIWKNLNSDERKIAIKALSKLIALSIGSNYCDNISQDKDFLLNLDAMNDNTIYIGDLENKTALDALKTVVYTYAAIITYNDILHEDDEDRKEMMLQDFESCKKCIDRDCIIDARNSLFVKNVSEKAVLLLKAIHKTMNVSSVIKNITIDNPPTREYLYNYYKDKKSRISKGGR